MTTEQLHPCDLVMQGGVASGVVYPPVILKLKEYYRFCNIGGTSAGAIAAVGAAAAEFNRENGGFKQLESMSGWLGQDKNLRNLFQPSAETKPLMVLVDAIFPPYQAPQQTESKPNNFQSLFQIFTRLLLSWLTNYPGLSLIAILGAVIGVILFALLPLAVLGLIAFFTSEVVHYSLIIKFIPILLGIIGGWLGYQIGGVVDAFIKLPANFYGICRGHDDTVQNVLIDWMSDNFNQTAGLKKDEPFTFGHMQNKASQNGQDAVINLKMITSNLSQGRPYLMPDNLKGFLFKEDEMRKLFPNYIVDHLLTYADKVQNPVVQKDLLPAGYHFLPDEEYLPVVVAMRLSLSFPILLSAIPLYTIKPSVLKAQHGSNQPLQESDLQKNWFSDGGICDNFPIEFFDIWLPTQPTFGISLTSVPADAFEGKQNLASTLTRPGNDQIKQLKPDIFSVPVPNNLDILPRSVPDVYLPKANDPPNSQWQQLEGVVQFLSAILGTGLGWYRTLQTNLPSYRDRIVQIRLSEAEGGLHLNMPQDVIEGMVIKGSQAADLLIPGPDPDKFNFASHEWVRYRVLMAKLEYNFEKMRETLQDPALREPLIQPDNDCPYPPPNNVWLTEADERLKELESLLDSWQKGTPDLFRKDEPQPETVLRVTPEV
jgi:predicted acylesterase/phospholipase RssA